MKTVVNKWGNSLAVRIPQPLAESLGLHEGSAVELDADAETLVIKKQRLTLSDLLATYDERQIETNWGPPRGNEIW